MAQAGGSEAGTMFVKICGTTSEEDALLAVAMGADAVGFVFAPSPRQVQPDTVRAIVHRLPREVLTVGVFRDELPERVVRVVHEVGLRAAQLHGREPPSVVRWVAERVPTTIKAFPAGSPDVERAEEFGVPIILLDAPRPGSGRVFDWTLAQGVPPARRLMLAGGLDARNVADAIAAVRPWGVDVTSGVEAAPGKKDPLKVRAFVAAAKLAAPPEFRPAGEGPYDWAEDA